MIDYKNKGLGSFEASVRGEVDAALAFDAAAQAAGLPENAKLRSECGSAAQRWRGRFRERCGIEKWESSTDRWHSRTEEPGRP
jgi:hypothetical protein